MSGQMSRKSTAAFQSDPEEMVPEIQESKFKCQMTKSAGCSRLVRTWRSFDIWALDSIWHLGFRI